MFYMFNFQKWILSIYSISAASKEVLCAFFKSHITTSLFSFFLAIELRIYSIGISCL